DVLVSTSVARNVVRIQQLVVVGKGSTLGVIALRITHHIVGIGLQYPVHHEGHGRMGNVVQKGVINTDRRRGTDGRARASGNQHIIGGVGNHVRAKPGDKLGKAVLVRNEVAV